MPSPLSFIKLRDAEYVDQFAGSVVPELKDAQKVLNERYDLAEENDSKRAAVAREMMQNVADKDKGQAQLAYEKAMGDIEANKARGDYENMYGKTANSARQFSVNAAKFIKEKKLMDDAWKDFSARKDILESEKQKIWDNNVMLANKPLTFNEKENVVEGEHFRPVNIAANIDALKTFTGYAEKMKADIDAGENERYGYFTPDGKRAKSTDAGAMLFHTTNGWKRERVTESEIEKMTMDVAEADPTFKDYTNRKIVQETGLLFKKIDEDPTLSPQEKQLQKADHIQKVKNDIKTTEYDPATRAVKNIFGYHNNADVNRLKADGLTMSDLKSRGAGTPPPSPFTGAKVVTEASDNPNATKEEDLEPSKHFQSYVKDADGNTIKSKTDIMLNVANQLSDPVKVEAIIPKLPREWRDMMLASRNNPEQRKANIARISESLAGHATNVNDASFYELFDKLDNSNTQDYLSVFGLSAVPYTEKEKTTNNTDEFFGNAVNSDPDKEENQVQIENRPTGSNLFNVLQEIEANVVRDKKPKDEVTKQRLVKETYNNIYRTALKGIKKTALPGDVRGDKGNSVLEDITWNNKDQAQWFIEHEGKTKNFSNFTSLQNFLIEEGLHAADKPIERSSFKIAHARPVSPQGNSGDMGVTFVTSKGKNINIFGKGVLDYQDLTKPINEVYANSFLKGRDKYKGPDNFGRIVLTNKALPPLDYFTQTVVNPNYNINTPDSKPYFVDVFFRPSGTENLFKSMPLESFTAAENEAIKIAMSRSIANNNPTKEDTKSVLEFENPLQYNETDTEELPR